MSVTPTVSQLVYPPRLKVANAVARAGGDAWIELPPDALVLLDD